jgi:hypothetical protein
LITNATISGVRPIKGGFRFALDLAPNFKVGNSDAIAFSTLSPGAYLVTYDGALHVQPRTPAQPIIATDSFRLSNPVPTALEAVQLEAQIKNIGLTDLPALHVSAIAIGADGIPRPITETTITVLAGEITLVRFAWVPPTAGAWRLKLLWNDTYLQALPVAALAQMNLQVRVWSAPQARSAQLESMSNMGQPALWFILLVSIGLGMAALVWTAFRWMRLEGRQ